MKLIEWAPSVCTVPFLVAGFQCLHDIHRWSSDKILLVFQSLLTHLQTFPLFTYLLCLSVCSYSHPGAPS